MKGGGGGGGTTIPEADLSTEFVERECRYGRSISAGGGVRGRSGRSSLNKEQRTKNRIVRQMSKMREKEKDRERGGGGEGRGSCVLHILQVATLKSNRKV